MCVCACVCVCVCVCMCLPERIRKWLLYIETLPLYVHRSLCAGIDYGGVHNYVLYYMYVYIHCKMSDVIM